MRTYLLNIIPQLSHLSQKLDSIALLTSKHWVVIDDDLKDNYKMTYIFRPNGELLISQVGKVKKARWEYLDNQSILIDKGDESFLFKHGFFNERLLALKLDGTNEYAVLVNQIDYEQGFRSSKDIQKILDGLNSQNVIMPNSAPVNLMANMLNNSQKGAITPIGWVLIVILLVILVLIFMTAK